MRQDFDKWWLLPLGILSAAALVALGIVLFDPPLVDELAVGVAKQPAAEPRDIGDHVASADCSSARATDHACHQDYDADAADEPAKTSEVAIRDCSHAPASDYVCYQQRYEDTVRGYGVEAAFAELRDELTQNELARSNCHELTHVIGRAAAKRYGDIPSTYGRGDSLCGSGYYHGAMETIVASVGTESIVDEASTLCADLSGHQRHSFFHYNCAHGLGHGFMGVLGNDLFGSLQTCDALKDEWERDRCYGGVFMENVVAKDNPSSHSKYLKGDRPLYPCDAVENRYKNECYQRQTSYALETQGNDFDKVFDLCSALQDGFRPACYQGLGWDASVQSIKQGTSDATINEFTKTLCMLGEDREARSNCVVGAVQYFIRDHYSNLKAKAFCESLDTDLRAGCHQEAEEYYRSLQSPFERQRAS